MWEMLALRSLRTVPSSAGRKGGSTAAGFEFCGRTMSKCKGRASTRANSASNAGTLIPRGKVFNMTAFSSQEPIAGSSDRRALTTTTTTIDQFSLSLINFSSYHSIFFIFLKRARTHTQNI